MRPTLAEYVLEMPRGAQVIYPKDLGPIMILADVFPGARVLESGVGSGALTLALLRAVGEHGHVTGYEIRDDFARRARTNVEGFLGPDIPLDIEVRDVYDGIGHDDLDRILLDLPEPWRVVKHAEQALHPGGIMLAYLPTIGQVSRLREELAGSPFGMIETLEVLQRTWHVDGQSVRPDHRMVAHTGFLTHARLLAASSLIAGVNFLDLVVVAVAAGAGWVGLPHRLRAAGHVVGGPRDRARDRRAARPRRRRRAARVTAAHAVAGVARVRGGGGRGRAGGRRRDRRIAVGAPRPRRRRAPPGRPGRGRPRSVSSACSCSCGCSSPRWRTRRAGRRARCATARWRASSTASRPSPPSESETLGRLVGDQTFPEVFDTLSSPDAGTPPADGIPAEAAARVTKSTLLVAGQACDRIQEGSGFVAGPNLVVTNAHVVAGERDTRVTTSDGRRLDANVVAFDPNRDLAVLRVPGLALPALALGEGQVDERGALFGHPGGGDLRQAPVRIAEQIVARGTDITRTNPTEREVFVLAAVTAPGDSGGPIVDADGSVIGVMFAYDISRQSTAYALTRTELDAVLGPVLANGSTAPVGTGDCLAE